MFAQKPLPGMMAHGASARSMPEYNDFMRFMNRISDGDVNIENAQQSNDSWTDEFTTQRNESGAEGATASTSDQEADWLRDFETQKAKQGEHFYN